MSARALLILDWQQDHFPGGAWPIVAPGSDLPARVAKLLPRFVIVVATQSWHAPDHVAFAASHPGRRVGEIVQIGSSSLRLRPPHCVRDTPGAGLAPPIADNPAIHVVRRGIDPQIDGGSAFYDAGRKRAIGLGDWLRERGVHELWLAGIAPDDLLPHTVHDGDRLGFQVYVLRDACIASAGAAALDDSKVDRVRQAGGRVCTVAEVPAETAEF